MVVTGTGTNINANVSVATTPGVTGTNWTMTSNFTLADYESGSAGTTVNILLGALGPSADLASTTTTAGGGVYRLVYTLASTGGAGRLSINQLGTSNITEVFAAGNLAPLEGQNYTLTFSGTYNGTGGINLAGSLTDGTNTLTVNAFDPSAASGQYFGMRSALNAGGSSTTTQTVNFNTFSVVPEPTSVGLLGVAFAGLLTRRRRQVLL